MLFASESKRSFSVGRHWGGWLLLGLALPLSAFAQARGEHARNRRAVAAAQCVPAPAGSTIEAVPVAACDGVADPEPLTSTAGPVGQGPWSFQWQRRTKATGWEAIEGATSPIYDPPRADYHDVWLRRMEINACGVVYSNEVSIPLREQQVLAAPGAIKGPTRPGSGELATYEVTGADPALGYEWTAPEGASILSGQGTARLTLKLPAVVRETTLVLAVAGVSACGAGPATTLDVVCRAAPGRTRPVPGRMYANRLSRGR